MDQLCSEFRKFPDAAYLESSLHARLYYLLGLKGRDRPYKTHEGYLMRGIQREYPTIEKDPGKGARGKLDLTIFDREAIASVDWWGHMRNDGSRRGGSIAPALAIEIGLNKGRAGGRTLYKKNELDEADEELRRLALPGNAVGRGLLLYFYRYVNPRQATSIDAILGVLRGWAGPVTGGEALVIMYVPQPSLARV